MRPAWLRSTILVKYLSAQRIEKTFQILDLSILSLSGLYFPKSTVTFDIKKLSKGDNHE
ncbi:MAG: hypothetical protein KAW12_10235 [Candidatus Aminicenantes bacterium]|nr:hypothetical protein [Candidatus Aminicenantes bacterium]